MKRTNAGPALRLVTRTAAPPFTVSGQGRVARLNADRVDGLHAAQLRTTHARVSYTHISTGAFSHTVRMTVPQGGWYTASYSAYMLSTAASGTGTAYCYLTDTADSTYAGWDSTSVSSGIYALVSGSGLVHLTAGTSVSLLCSAPFSWRTPATGPVELSLTRLDGVATVSATSTRSGRDAVPR